MCNDSIKLFLKYEDGWILEVCKECNGNYVKLFSADAFIGRNGATCDKKEGDGKTPIGEFEFGVAFGMHDNLETDLPYIKINDSLYWVDDVNSMYYNQLVDIDRVHKDWKSAEHLIDYPKQYEYAVEIKCNANNVPGKGSALFLHCEVGRPTAGCIAIDREKMIDVLKLIGKDAIICVAGKT